MMHHGRIDESHVEKFEKITNIKEIINNWDLLAKKTIFLIYEQKGKKYMVEYRIIKEIKNVLIIIDILKKHFWFIKK